jgi:hypothetical protein
MRVIFCSWDVLTYFPIYIVVAAVLREALTVHLERSEYAQMAIYKLSEIICITQISSNMCCQAFTK